MPRGGFRPGAGRPRKGAEGKAGQNVRAAKAAIDADPVSADAVLADDQVSPLEFLLNMVNDPSASPADRFRAAVAAAPYVHARAEAAVAGKKEQRKETAQKASDGGKFGVPSAPKLIVNNGS